MMPLPTVRRWINSTKESLNLPPPALPLSRLFQTVVMLWPLA